MCDKNSPRSSLAASPEHGAVLSVPVLLGPTAVGKSAVALELAAVYGWEIISCDSRQLYRGMDIGTAKPSLQERAAAVHHLIDILDPSEEYSAGRFADEAVAVIRERAAAGKTTLICGGTGLYFRALQQGQSNGRPSDPAIRDELTRRAREQGSETLHRELAAVDAATAARLHPNDAQRIIRALALFRQTGKPLSDHPQEGTPPEGIRFIVVKLTLDRAQLYDRINRRVDAMVRSGLLEEFRKLRTAGFDRLSPGMQSVGYREFFGVEDGIMKHSDAVELIKRNSRRYAKRQITWFAHQVEGAEVDAEDTGAAVEQAGVVFERER